MKQSHYSSSSSSTANSSHFIQTDVHTKSQILLKSAIQKHESGEIQQAIKNYLEAISLNPTKASAYYNLAILYKGNEKYTESIQCFHKAIQIYPNYIQAYINMANVYKKIKKYKQAQKYYLKAIKKNPTQTGAITNLGLLYKHEGNYKQAQVVFKRITEMDPKNASAFNNLAVVQKNLKKIDDAVLNWNLAIKINPDFADAYYNLGLFETSRKQYQKAEDYLKKADQLKNNPIVLVVRAINLTKINCLDRAYQILQRINVLLNSQSLESIEKRTNIRKGNLKWIKTSLGQLNTIVELNKSKSRMSIKQQQNLKQINDEYFASFIDVEAKDGQNQQIKQLNKKIQDLKKQFKNQLQQHKVRLVKVQSAVVQIKQQIQNLKKQFQWDNNFDKLLEQQPQNAVYYKSLYTLICTSIQAYRSVKTGIVNGGQGIIKSKLGGFVDKLVKILNIGKAIPFATSFCTAIVKFGQIYLGAQSQFVIDQIISATNSLFNEKKLSKATAQTIIYLSKQKQFKKLFQRQKEQKVWYHKLIKRVQEIQKKIDKKKTKVLNKMTQFETQDISEQMNMAMAHCTQIMIFMIDKHHFKYISQSKNPLLSAAQCWISNISKIKLNVLGAVLQQNQGIFASKLKPYCKVRYGSCLFETEVNKNFGQNPSWQNSQFILKKQTKLQQIIFQVYDRPILKSERLVGTGWIYDNYEKEKNHSVDLFDIDKNQIGSIQILLL